MNSARALRLALGACVLALASAGPGPSAATPAPGHGITLRTTDGQRLPLATLLAEGPVLLDFWATWCRPCERSLPATQTLHELHRESGLRVIGISVDGPRNWARVQPFAARLGLTFPVVIDEDGSLAARYRAVGVPTTVLIARDGRVVRTRTGWHPGEDDSLAVAVAALLDSGGGSR